MTAKPTAAKSGRSSVGISEGLILKTSLAVFPSRPSTGLYSVCGREELPSGHEDVGLLSTLSSFGFKARGVKCNCLVTAGLAMAAALIVVALRSALAIGDMLMVQKQQISASHVSLKLNPCEFI